MIEYIVNNGTWLGMFFVGFVSFVNGTTDSRSYFFRLAGNLTGKRSMGWAIHNAFFTLNRASALTVILFLAILLDLQMSSVDMAWICVSAIIGVSIANLITLFTLDNIKEKAIKALLIYEDTESLLKTFIIFFTPISGWFYGEFRNINFSRFLSNSKPFKYSMMIYTLFGLSLFLIVYLASNFLSYRAVILQSTAIINCIGTFYLTSILDPMLSRKLDKKDNFEEIFMDVMYGRVLAYSFICPLVFLIIILITF